MFKKISAWIRRRLEEDDRIQAAKRARALCRFCKARPKDPDLGWCTVCDGEVEEKVNDTIRHGATGPRSPYLGKVS